MRKNGICQRRVYNFLLIAVERVKLRNTTKHSNLKKLLIYYYYLFICILLLLKQIQQPKANGFFECASKVTV